MRNYINYIVAVILVIATSCNTSGTQKNTADMIGNPSEENLKSKGFSDMSIYNLPSHWTTQNGNTIEMESLKGKVLVMVMIYTSCQAACPRLVADMRNIENQIPENAKNNVQYIFVSIDPKTDTPKRLKAFAIENEMDDDKWMFLRGNEEDTREFAAVLAVNYKKISPMDFSHSNIISVFNEIGEMVYQQEGLGVDNKEIIKTIVKLAEDNF